MAYFIVYKTTHVPTGRFYIGRHATEGLEDSYLGSGIILRQMVRAHRRDEFQREILHLATSGEEMLELEEKAILEILDEELCLNCTVGDPRTRGSVRHSEQTKRRMSEAGKIAVQNRIPEHWEKIAAANRARKSYVAASRSRIGTRHTEESKRKMSETKKKNHELKKAQLNG